MVNVAQIVTEVSVERSSLVGRPTVRGKFLYVGREKFWVRGISYGTFFVDENGEERFTPETVERDFAQMATNGFNVVRVHTGPPRWLLDVALEHGLRVMVGLNWGEHMAFLDEPGKVEEIEGRIRRWIRVCAGHPAVFGYSIGNEIPASIVRWHGRRRVERFIERLYRIAKEEDPNALVTYVNYPSTEYLQLPFLDFVSFNVYLESPRSLEDYLARLHSLSDDRPMLLSEIGLDSLRNGEEKQAAILSGQVRIAFRLGCAGVVVFAWTDEWYHGKFRVEDWAFGLTTQDRTPKPALQAVSRAFAESPFSPDLQWPKISVVVSTLNGAATLRDTLAGLEQLDYPDYEVIVVNDGSTDATPQIASEYHVRLITTKNQGRSAARNVGTRAAAGEIVAVCWRLRDRGGLIGYWPAAVVWHHRRKSLRRFCKQQVGYGRAEALLEHKWPARYNSIGQLSWRGRLYGRGVSLDFSAMHGRVYQGVWGTAPFQSLYESRNSRWSMALAPEWYLMIALLAGMFLLSLGWGASIVVGPILLVAIVLPIAQASISARRANFVAGTRKPWWSLLGLRVVVLVLDLLQPMARLRGRIRGGLTPWRRRGPPARRRYRRLEVTYWRDKREAPEETLRKLQAELSHAGAIARAGGEFDSWDLELSGGPLGRSRLLLAVEEHAPGKQFLRFRVSPKYSKSAVVLSAAFAALAISALWSGVWLSGLVSAIAAAFVVARALTDTGFSGGIMRDLLERFGAA